MDEWKSALGGLYQSMLGSFLDSGARLAWQRPEAPVVSVVLVLYNRADMTLRCLRSLSEPQGVPFEILIVDNDSRDDTDRLLERLSGVGTIRNADNRGFIRAANQAARRARGRHLLFLNNDAELMPGSLAVALETLERSPDVGAVGAKLVLTDGRLQEAGCIVWNDGSCAGYGRGESPAAPAYNFRRDVDFVSGAFLLTPRELFLAHGGFDEAYAPAYYEDVDYCVKLWECGRRVVYEPRAVAVHFEFASSASMAAAVLKQAERQSIFKARHTEWLRGKLAPRPENVVRARETAPPAGDGLRLLFVDDRVPHEHLGSGFPRSREMLTALVRLGHHVTFYPLSFPTEAWDEVYADVPREIEVLVGLGREGFAAFLRARAQSFDAILVSRPHNMALLRPILFGDGIAPPPVVYDAEALSCLRETSGRTLVGATTSPDELRALVAEEARLAHGTAAVVAVSEAERALFGAAGIGPVFVLGHTVAIEPSQAPFDARDGILFVGAIHDDASPNADAVLWFEREVLPRVRDALGSPVPFRVVGVNRSPRVSLLAERGVEVLGRIGDLAPLYDRARLFVAPNRFGAGIPLKAYHAAARGLPIVCTRILSSQLNWSPGRELLVGDDAAAFAERCLDLYRDAELWERVREAALARVAAECSRTAFEAQLGRALREAVAGPAQPAGVDAR